jgi:D-glycero-D-manno-heptose 1,7-bisphosphate phosphatase
VSARPVLLDRDGTIVVDHGYLDDPERLSFLPQAAEGLRLLHRAGHPLIVITNQSGVGRGLFSLERMHQVNRRLAEMMAAAGAPLTGLYACPHRPEDACDCRKPNTALVRQAAAELQFEPATAVMVGDKDSDIELGRRMHATTIRLVAAGRHAATPAGADFTVRDLVEAARCIANLAPLAQRPAAGVRGG